jgi:hypothetical protein
MWDLIGFILELFYEKDFVPGPDGKERVIGGFIGCLGGSVLYALTGGRLDLENDDWRSLLMGLLIVGSAMIVFALLLWWLLR